MTNEPNVVITQEIIDGAIGEIESFIPYWRSGFSGPQEKLSFVVFNGAPFRGYRRYGRLTWHEEMLMKWTPGLEPQVTFGTGPGGRKKWGATSYTADFLDREGSIIYEIDGPSHRSRRARIRDARKDAFLAGLGYEVFRLPNALIEQWAKEAVRHYGQWKARQVEPDEIQIMRAEIVLQKLVAYKRERERARQQVIDADDRFGLALSMTDADTSQAFAAITDAVFGLASREAEKHKNTSKRHHFKLRTNRAKKAPEEAPA